MANVSTTDRQPAAKARAKAVGKRFRDSPGPDEIAKVVQEVIAAAESRAEKAEARRWLCAEFEVSKQQLARWSTRKVSSS